MANIGSENEISSNSHAAGKGPGDKLKIARERQNEERMRKIEELRVHAEAAQRYREQKEEERRRRLEEMRVRDLEKRQQVEERKRVIMEAEKERREYILKKNQEIDSRLETKKRERNSINFAFGSSTPRLLEPTEFGMVSTSNFWGPRRSTSITNVTGASLSRRSSERELSDCGSKSRVTGIMGTSQYDDENSKSQIVFRSVARRKTDLVPTVPTPREGYYGSKSSLNSNTPRTAGRVYSMSRLDQLAQPIRRNGEHIRAILERERREGMDDPESMYIGSFGSGSATRYRGGNKKHQTMSRSMTHLASGQSRSSASSMRFNYSLGGGMLSSFRSSANDSRSGDVTPSGNSRPTSAMSTATTMSTSGFIKKRPYSLLRKPRPASVGGTALSIEELNKLRKENRPPIKSTSPPSAVTPQRSSANLMSKSMIVTSSSRLLSAEKKSAKKDPYSSKSSNASLSKTSSIDRLHKLSKPKETPTSKSTNTSSNDVYNVTKKSQLDKAPTAGKTNKLEKENRVEEKPDTLLPNSSSNESNQLLTIDIEKDVKIEKADKEMKNSATLSATKKSQNGKDIGTERSLNVSGNGNGSGNASTLPQGDLGDMLTASMNAKNKITTEEEAKAALAERRRLAREEAERQAQAERQRIENEALAEMKRLKEEAERQRAFEEEAIRLAEEQRQAEEQRLRQAIEETKQREAEELRKREEEERLRIEREEAEKKARDEAEKQRIEVAERLQREEKEREERRKRVEAIMSRTRKRNSAATPVKDDDEKTQNAPIDSDKQSQYLGAKKGGEADADTAPASETTTTTEATTIKAQTATMGNLQNTDTQQQYEQNSRVEGGPLIQNFSNMVIDENLRNFQHEQTKQISQNVDVTNGKVQSDFLDENIFQNINVANGNGLIENISRKNILQETVTPTNQLIDLSITSQDINNTANYNNNSLLTATPLVTSESYENKDISLL